MATKKSGSAVKSAKPKQAKKTVVAKTTVKEKVVAKTSIFENKKDKVSKNPLKGFFARKYTEDDSILTIFKRPRIYGALIGELIGVMLLTIFFLAFGVLESIGMNLTFQLNLQILFVYIGVTLAVFAISGAQLNPIITAGMMATRRTSVIRGVVYILAQIVGAWVGFLIVNAFCAGGGEAAAAADINMPVAKMWADGQFWLYAILALLTALILGFFFARAIRYKKSAFTFAAIVGGGVLAAMMIAFAIQTSFFAYPETYALANNAFTFNNPAIALMHQIIPTTGADFLDILGQVGLSLAVYVGFPVVGSVAGFYLSDASERLAKSGEAIEE